MISSSNNDVKQRTTSNDVTNHTIMPEESNSNNKDNDIINEIPDKEKYSTSELNRLGACYLVKKEGNKFFQMGEYSKAIEEYEKLEKYMGILLKEEKHLSDPLKVLAETNIALCHIRMGEYSQAITRCEAALKIDPKSIKSLYRRGIAHMEQGLYEEAKSDFDAVLELDSDNGDAHKMLKNLNKAQKESSMRQNQMFGGMFKRVALYDDKKNETTTTTSDHNQDERTKNNVEIKKIKEEVSGSPTPNVLLMFLCLMIIVLGAVTYIFISQTGRLSGDL